MVEVDVGGGRSTSALAFQVNKRRIITWYGKNPRIHDIARLRRLKVREFKGSIKLTKGFKSEEASLNTSQNIVAFFGKFIMKFTSAKPGNSNTGNHRAKASLECWF